MTERIQLENIAIVLHRPRVSENIGAAARAMCNMGIRRLIVVAPKQRDPKRILKMATHAAAEVVEQIEYVETLEQALAPFNLVVGTTARLGRRRQVFDSPAKLARELIPVSRSNHVALLFGPEDRGLTAEDLRLCHWLVNIPTSEFSSLNLAQAVMVLCYALFVTGRQGKTVPAPRLAERHELDGMYTQVQDILVRINYINPENPEYWMDKIRHYFTRMQLRAREVSVIRGICRQINWYAGKCYEDGRKRRDT